MVDSTAPFFFKSPLTVPSRPPDETFEVIGDLTYEFWRDTVRASPATIVRLRVTGEEQVVSEMMTPGHIPVDRLWDWVDEQERKT